MSKLFNKNKKGFTLIEVIVVVAIMAILAAIAIPNVSKNIENQRKVSAKYNTEQVYRLAISAVTSLKREGVTNPSAQAIVDKIPSSASDIVVSATPPVAGDTASPDTIAITKNGNIVTVAYYRKGVAYKLNDDDSGGISYSFTIRS